MRLRQLLESFSLFYLFSLVAVVATFAAFDDTLFFASDFLSAFVLCGAVAAAPAMLLCLAALAAAGVGRPRAVRALVEGVLPALVVSLAALMLLDTLQREFRIIGFVGGEQAGVLIALACAALFAVLAIRRARTRDDGVTRRMTRLAVVVTPVCVAVVAGWVAHGHLGRARGGAEPRHVVLVVLDGWPATSHLHTFDPSIPPAPIDSLFKDALVFRNAHTNAVWTFGFFDALYRGVPRYEPPRPVKFRQRLSRMGRADEPTWALLPALQALGVRTRWIAYHRTGVPESHFVSAYKGFRSVHLTQRYAGLMRALSLDYNAILPNATIRRLFATPRRRLLFDALNTEDRFEDELHDALLPEIRSLRRGANRTFLLFHGRWPAGRVELPPAWDEPGASGERERLNAAIKAREYRYGADEEWYAEELRTRNRAIIDRLSGKIIRLVADMEREGLMQNTLLVFTADHGSMFERGRFWYAYHADEEVSHVPLVVFGAGRSGVDDHRRESIDIPMTIVEYFGGTDRPSTRAVSLFSSQEKTFTTTITRRSKKNDEWFLTLYSPEGKFRFNLEPEGGGESLLLFPGSNGDSLLADGPEVIEQARSPLRQAMIEYGLRGSEVHERYRALLPGAE